MQKTTRIKIMDRGIENGHYDDHSLLLRLGTQDDGHTDTGYTFYPVYVVPRDKRNGALRFHRSIEYVFSRPKDTKP